MFLLQNIKHRMYDRIDVILWAVALILSIFCSLNVLSGWLKEIRMWLFIVVVGLVSSKVKVKGIILIFSLIIIYIVIISKIF